MASYPTFLIELFALEDTMNTHLEVLESEALKLDPADRSHLLERLIASLDVDPEVEQLWELEADRRVAELNSGASIAIPGEEAMAHLRAVLAGFAQ
jgi:putative addiction module component (TIGR02574 family)